MSKGIVLQSFGNYGYHYAAINLAASIKAHNPDVKITWFRHPHGTEYIRKDTPNFFDEIIDLPDDVLHEPGWAKIDVLGRLPYDCNLILDVDAIVLKDITPLLDGLIKSKKTFITQIMGEGKKGEEIPYDIWAKHEHSYPFFELKDTDIWHTTQTSWFYAKKGKNVEKIHSELCKFWTKGFDKNLLKNRWGRYMPDELFFSGVISKLKINAEIKEDVMFFGSRIVDFSEVNRHYIMSLYGAGIGNSTTRMVYWEYYDRLMAKIMRQHGYTHNYKGSYIQEHKIVNSL
jgi:hypothetical protein